MNNELSDPLFTGMIRPALVMGVPMEWFGINFIIFGIGMILFASLSAKLIFIIFVCLPLQCLGRILTLRDPCWMRVLIIRFSLCGPVANRHFWKCNSYSP
jgi:type IV secretion system protein VirB3